jgi:hypothetical protein
METHLRYAWSVLASSLIFISGCSVSQVAQRAPVSTPDPGPSPSSSTPLQGKVHGGQQPIQGARVYMLAVTVGGQYGQQSQYLLSGTGLADGNGHAYVNTDGSGIFNITSGEYSCGARGVSQLVYLYSSGGNPGLSGNPTPNNKAAGLMAVLGMCTNKTFSQTLPAKVQMNEVTTIAAAYALAGYATDATHISGNENEATTGTMGLANAAATAWTLASLTTGDALTPGLYGTAVQMEINTLGNILASCVNVSGPTAGKCPQVLPNAQSDTAAAAIYIAQNPGSNIGPLFSAATSYQPFSPALSAAPNDWTIGITYGGNNYSMSGPQELAIDAYGNVWVTNNDTCNGGGYCLTELSPQGVDLSGPNGYTGGGLNGSVGIAIDASGNVWVANSGNSSLSEFTPAANNGVGVTAVSGANGFTLPISDPENPPIPWELALDSQDDVWITDVGNSYLFEYSSGAFIYTSGQFEGGLDTPSGIAIDSNDDIWIADPDGLSGNQVSEFDPVYNIGGQIIGATPDPGGPYTAGSAPEKPAIDPYGYVWVSNYGGPNGGQGSDGDVSSIWFWEPGQMPAVTYLYSVGGIQGTYGGAYSVAIDGAGNVWSANYGPNETAHQMGTDTNPVLGSVSELNNNGGAMSPPNGYQPGLNQAIAIAIDASGNVWTVINGQSNVLELVGAATPVATPMRRADPAGLP